MPKAHHGGHGGHKGKNKTADYRRARREQRNQRPAREAGRVAKRRRNTNRLSRLIVWLRRPFASLAGFAGRRSLRLRVLCVLCGCSCSDDQAKEAADAVRARMPSPAHRGGARVLPGRLRNRSCGVSCSRLSHRFHTLEPIASQMRSPVRHQTRSHCPLVSDGPCEQPVKAATIERRARRARKEIARHFPSAEVRGLCVTRKLPALSESRAWTVACTPGASHDGSPSDRSRPWSARRVRRQGVE